MSEQNAKKLVSILPAPPREGESSASGDTQTALRPKRSMVYIACEFCRQSKVKCNGARPTCNRCLKKGKDCVYKYDRTGALIVALQEQRNDLDLEVAQYRELFEHLRTKSEAEALEILRRIRLADEPRLILNAIRQGNMTVPDPSPLRSTNPHIARLDQQTLAQSLIKVPARPWTAVAGDGLVSELITRSFSRNGAYYYPFLDRDAFLEDMASGNTNTSRWCTPLLVSAICALESNFSEKANHFTMLTKQDVGVQFLREAQDLLEYEQSRASIPTVLALALVSLTLTFAGKEKAGRMYRYTAYALLHQLQLEERFWTLREIPGSTREMRVISRALWGLFVLECRIAYFYAQPSILPVPAVPKPFDVPSASNVNALGQEVDATTKVIPLVPGMTNVNCDLAELWGDVMRHVCETPDKGSDDDLRTREDYYERLTKYSAQLPPRLQFEQNMIPATCLVRMHETEIVLTILRGLPLDASIKTSPDGSSSTVKDIILQRVQVDVPLMERYVQTWISFDSLVCRHAQLCAHALVPYLDEPVTHTLFTTVCMLVAQAARVIKLMGVHIQIVQAFAWASGKIIPATARPFLVGWGAAAITEDLPISFILPLQDDLKDAFLAKHADELSEEGGRIGAMMILWARNQEDF